MSFCLANLPVSIKSQTNTGKTVDRYSEAKKEMNEDVYLVYRMLERIMQTNKIAEQAGITVRSTSPEECFRLTGNEDICNVIGDLPDIKAKDSMFAWAVQVVSSNSSSPNASASSKHSLIRIQKSLVNALSGNPAAVACVVGHELAHLTEKHSKKIYEKGSEFDDIASVKISSAIGNAKKAQKSQQIWASIAMGLNAAAGTYQGALSNYQLANSMAADSAEGAQAFRFMQANYPALRENAPKSLSALESLDGLGAQLIKRTKVDIDKYLDEYRLGLMSFSRLQELEADAKGIEYVAKAGIDPNACLDVLELLHRNTGDKATPTGSSHPGENERKTHMQEMISQLSAATKNKHKLPITKVPMLPYTYDAESQVVRIMPAGSQGLKAGKNNKSSSVDALLGN